MLSLNHVEGKDHVALKIYTLSTCGWCKRTKALLHELGLAYDYVDVDLLGKEEAAEALQEIMKWNPKCSFPTIVVDGTECISGYQEERLRGLATP